ncbi:Tetratricopeptide repeat protein 25 [Boothiomyces macroporosus]|uniref:Outer dynein arm-docking complex subunit 4 n=1 Tax=Boothiomyces macroporosus TaxID=261099 RepID=A0AAD5UC86_9FUNG|nr:Tetratricopeptide repeat protein 25 [Boothiomyces macroporosus]
MAKDDIEEEEVDEIISSFQSYAAEGDILAKQGNYQKSIEAYTKLQLGDTQKALQDADTSLTEEVDFFKGVFQKAEALYSQGDFELALVYYHRGNQFRPEVIDDPTDYKFQPPPGARLVISVPTGQNGGATTSKQPFLSGVWVSPKQPTQPGQNSTTTQAQKDPKIGKSAKQLLGELYADQEYLENFVKDKDLNSNPNSKVKSLVDDALKYLDMRTEFWRQQKPIYARKKETSKVLTKQINQRNRQSIIQKAEDHKKREALKKQEMENPKTAGGYKSKKIPENPIKKQQIKLEEKNFAKNLIETSMQIVNNYLSKGDFQTALRKTKTLLTKIQSPEFHNVETTTIVTLGKEMNSDEWCVRALAEIGKIHVYNRKYKKAIDALEAGVKITPDGSIEKAWLLHDIGQCYLRLKDFTKAKTYGERSVAISDSLNNPRWGLSSRVLIGQASSTIDLILVAVKNYDKAHQCYTTALEFSNELEDKHAQEILAKELEHLKKHRDDIPELIPLPVQIPA